MTNAEKKKILRQYIWLKKRIEAENNELAELITLIHSPKLDGLPASFTKTDLSNFIIREDAILERKLKYIDRLTSLVEKIDTALDEMENEKERHLLELRYKHGMTFEQIAEDMSYSWRHILNLHGYALSHFMEGKT